MQQLTEYAHTLNPTIRLADTETYLGAHDANFSDASQPNDPTREY